MKIDGKRLSHGRTQIMGSAMLVVLLFHSSLNFSECEPLNFIKQSGDIGVDLFLLMAGFGASFAVEKYVTTKAYIVSRVKRIVPAYLLVTFPWFFLQDILLSDAGVWALFCDVTSLSFWLDGRLTTWYLSALLVLQIFTPWYIQKIEQKPGRDWYAMLLAAGVAFIITLTPLRGALDHLLIIIYRIPVYLLGISFGKRIMNNPIVISKGCAIGGFLVGILVIMAAYGYFPIYIPWVFKYAAYLPITVCLSVVLAKIPQFGWLRFLGTRSLEIYLLHEKILWGLSVIARHIAPTFTGEKLLLNTMAVLCACIVAELLHRMVAKVIK